VDHGHSSSAQRLQKTAAEPAIQPIQVSPSINQLLDGPDEPPGSGRRDKQKGHQ
jgi:hypothetical protein